MVVSPIQDVLSGRHTYTLRLLSWDVVPGPRVPSSLLPVLSLCVVLEQVQTVNVPPLRKGETPLLQEQIHHNWTAGVT